MFSTVLGLILFLVEIGLLCWIRFNSLSRPAAITTTVLLVIIVGVFMYFVFQFYLKLVNHQFSNAERVVDHLEREIIDLQNQTIARDNNSLDHHQSSIPMV